jgi:hypothetical protein
MFGVKVVVYPSTISTGSIWNGTSQYSEKAHTKVNKQIIALGLLRAVTSMKTLLVSIEIFEASEFIIGGTEHTLP